MNLWLPMLGGITATAIGILGIVILAACGIVVPDLLAVLIGGITYLGGFFIVGQTLLNHAGRSARR